MSSALVYKHPIVLLPDGGWAPQEGEAAEGGKHNTIAANSGTSNRFVADNSGVSDDGQMSRLLTRLERAGLIENGGQGRIKGEANAWALTERGEAVQAALAGG